MEHGIPHCRRKSTLDSQTSQSELSLADAMHQFDTGDRNRRGREALGCQVCRPRRGSWIEQFPGLVHALVHLRQLRRYERQQRERIWADDDKQPKASDVRACLGWA